MPTPVFDTDAAARKPFQAHVDLSLTTSKAAITIPPGKRLVIEHMAAVAFASSESGPIQPLVVVYASHGGSPVQDFEYVMTPYALISNQFSLAQQVTIYADTLSISIGFAGYTPIQLAEGVSISGYLVNITAPQ